MMLRLGFSDRWVSRIMKCVSTVAYSFLLNGEVCGWVQPTRGLRQGDPLSPYLFLICAEGLSALIQKSHKDGHISGFKCSRSGHDSLLFTRATDANCVAVKRVLKKYSAASRQLVNFSKSALCVSPSVDSRECERLAKIVGMQAVECHEKYLGLSCITGRHKRKMFADIVDRVWGKVKGWGDRLLSVGGKEVLIKRVIQSIPTYSMGLSRVPKGLIFEIQRLSSRFWWGSNQNSRKLHWCMWDRLCKPKVEGALLARQCWRILKFPNSLAATILKGKYFHDSNIWEASSSPSASFLWNSLMWGRGIIEAGIRWRVGRGSCIRIYGDRWIPRPSTFKIISPQVLDVNATVETLMSPSGGWDVDLVRQFL
ncbi:hypothetical protein Dsin_017492 [Dipteronia sinensis]|uniref:Reverse transcriptase domain-containing protein n=1 Tax=Dipteronia sinensis TaxID=43782 RepID=A0AAE0AF22_9ROSI|nr:hypothetical protein Dsin_017492 [Dipteronia sinensis]